MKTLKAYFLSLLLVMTLTLSGCELVGDIFQAGMWTAVIVIVLIVLLIGWLLRKMRR
ncbi:hypothetical protein [Nibribacter ruber]|uniref:hypothetical protein n=1 Tax=Nibribacter ruber TaxID=2698458 RepID=UPI0018D978AF|nr:hypothetical protein [Nibribacter ruber]